MTYRISVVIATYNRSESLVSLLNYLSEQDMSPDRFEVILVDDGSTKPVRPLVTSLKLPYRLELVEQANAGQAAARDTGIRKATGEIIVILDDDMVLPKHFLRAHDEAHRQGNSLVLGYIRPASKIESLPLFERFHAKGIDDFVDATRRGERVRGASLCTGNVSFRREDYLAIGGFDRTLERSEDRDLGIRLEVHGARVTFAEQAYTIHESDHTDLAKWLRRARLYGACDSRIAAKHPNIEYVDPWRFLFLVNPISRPLLLLAHVSPTLGSGLSRAAWEVSKRVDSLGAPAAAVAGTTLVYGLEYFMGMRDYNGSLKSSLQSLVAYARKRRTASRN